MILSEPAQYPPCILLVEDDAAMRAVVGRALQRAGFHVIEAGTGEEALEWLAEVSSPRCQLELVISDLRLPGYDGLNLLATIRQQARNIPVILITAFGTTSLHAAAHRLGAVATLDKPFSLDELIDLARAALGGEHNEGGLEDP